MRLICESKLTKHIKTHHYYCGALHAHYTCKLGHQWYQTGVASFPDLLLLFFSLHTWKQKSGEKQGRPGNTYHVNEVGWMQGGRRGKRSAFKYTCILDFIIECSIARQDP